MPSVPVVAILAYSALLRTEYDNPFVLNQFLCASSDGLCIKCVSPPRSWSEHGPPRVLEDISGPCVAAEVLVNDRDEAA